MVGPKQEAERWLLHAERDLGFARLGMEIGDFAPQACLMVHQCAEKALKALLFLRGSRFIGEETISTLLARAADAHPGLMRYQDMAARLDRYYVTSRYLDTLPGGAPDSTLDEVQATEVIGEGDNLILEVRNIIRLGR